MDHILDASIIEHRFLAKEEMLLISQYNLLWDELQALPEQGMNEIWISPFTISAFLNM